MATPTAQSTITVALVGNPNTGKSTLFNSLSGVRQRVGNYPGVTVEKRVGKMQHEGRAFEVVDLPGTYSLAPRSLDEMVAVDVLLGRRGDVASPDVVISIVDASNLERHLYLVSQVLELGCPVVLALNMTDLAKSRGITIDVAKLRERLGVPVIEMQANRGHGIADLKTAMAAAAQSEMRSHTSPFSSEFCGEVQALERSLHEQLTPPPPRYLAERLLLDSGGYVEDTLLGEDHAPLKEQLQAARQRLADAGQAVPAIEAIARYAWVAEALDGVVTRPAEHRETVTDKIDRVLTHKVFGTLIFAAVMLVVFTSIFRWATPMMDLIGDGVAALGEFVGAAIPEGALHSLVVDGIIGGVGAVVVFLPQILILFFLLAILEDCGYMARAAYLMDKLMVRAGLSGKSFIPMLSSFACAVPGIMATRVIENRRDRFATIMVAPLMSCSARLPVYTILILGFIPPTSYLGGLVGLRGLTMFAMYSIGVVVAVVVALLLKRSILKGETPPFVMELPSYKFPSPSAVLHRVVDRGWAFLRRAGTVIFAVTIVIWAANYYPRNQALVNQEIASQRSTLVAQLEQPTIGGQARSDFESQLTAFDDENQQAILRASLQQKYSVLGRMGRFIEPVVRPLGWDWRIGCAAIASFPAREVVMGVLGVIYSMSSEQDLDLDDEHVSSELQSRMRNTRWEDTGEKVYNVPVALSIMVFFALCAQCAATLAVIRRETNSWRWPIFTFVYMTVLAYVGALITYQVGMLFVA